MMSIRLRRTQLSVPASQQKMIDKARNLSCDYMFLDLEDAVSPNKKIEARSNAVESLKTSFAHMGTVGVRVNAVDSPWFLDDVLALTQVPISALKVLILPKIRTAREVLFLDDLLHHRAPHLAMEVLIEETQAMLNIKEIAQASKRLEALIFGMGDYAASQGIPGHAIGEDVQEYDGDLLYYPRFTIAMTARAFGLDAIDAAYADFKNETSLKKQCHRARLMGFAGKWSIHPSQIDTIQGCFTPDPKDVEHASKVVSLYQKAEDEGHGATMIDNVMADAATVRMLKTILQKDSLIKQQEAHAPS